jgi:hypothetical protein
MAQPTREGHIGVMSLRSIFEPFFNFDILPIVLGVAAAWAIVIIIGKMLGRHHSKQGKNASKSKIGDIVGVLEAWEYDPAQLAKIPERISVR